MSNLISYLAALLLFLSIAVPSLAKGQGQPVVEDTKEMIEESSGDSEQLVQVEPVEQQPAPIQVLAPVLRDPYQPNEDGHVMRYIKGIGWRKFSPEGAAEKDWSDYKKMRPWYRR